MRTTAEERGEWLDSVKSHRGPNFRFFTGDALRILLDLEDLQRDNEALTRQVDNLLSVSHALIACLPQQDQHHHKVNILNILNQEEVVGENN